MVSAVEGGAVVLVLVLVVEGLGVVTVGGQGWRGQVRGAVDGGSCLRSAPARRLRCAPTT